MKAESPLMHRIWWRYSDMGLPLWLWRPYCWIKRHHEDDSYGSCVICFKDLTS